MGGTREINNKKPKNQPTGPHQQPVQTKKSIEESGLSVVMKDSPLQDALFVKSSCLANQVADFNVFLLRFFASLSCN